MDLYFPSLSLFSTEIPMKMRMTLGVAFFCVVSLLLFIPQSYADLDCVACHGPNGAHGEGFEGCNVCHGYPPSTSEPGADGLVAYPSPTGGTSPGGHGKHATADGYSYPCQTCHSGGMTAQGGIIQNPRQLEMGFNIFGTIGGVYDGRTLSAPYSYTAAPGTTVTTSGSMTCSTIYCHSDGTSVSTTVVPAFISPAWTSQGPLVCTSCHGYPPAYAHDSPKSNLHADHAVGIGCNYCHYATTNDGIHITDTTKHINGQYDVNANSAIGSEITYTWDRGGGTCSNVRCHGVLHHDTKKTWNDEIENIDISYTPNTSGFHLGEEFKFKVVPGYLCSLRFPGVSYLWDFGDGGTSTDPEPTHIYTAPGDYPISVEMRDADYHPASAGGRVVQIATPQNVPPVSAMSVSVSGSTITVTDLSYDPDYNIYGNSGPGQIDILWGDFTKTSVPINLTDSPSNQVYTHTSSMNNYNLSMSHVVRDNRMAPAIMPTAIGFRTPVVANSISISGRLTRSGAASSLQGRLKLKKNNGLFYNYFSDPNSQGEYQFVSIPPGCYTVEPLPVTGYTFNPVLSVPICTSTTGVDFTVTKP